MIEYRRVEINKKVTMNTTLQQKKEPVTLTEIEMIGKDVVAELLLDSNTTVEWIDGDEDRNGERILHMAMPQWKLLDVIDRQLQKRITQTNDSDKKEESGGTTNL